MRDLSDWIVHACLNNEDDDDDTDGGDGATYSASGLVDSNRIFHKHSGSFVGRGSREEEETDFDEKLHSFSIVHAAYKLVLCCAYNAMYNCCLLYTSPSPRD